MLRAMSGPMRYNPPPNWPAPPAGWTPPPGWTPDPSWPPPPAGWPVWLPEKKRSKIGLILLGAGAILLIGVVAAVAGNGDTKTQGSGAANVVGGQSSSSSSSSSSSEAAAYVPKPSDFVIRIKVRAKQCFGSAGCLITYRIDPSYRGRPFRGSYDITYRVSGDESGPQTNTFTIDEAGNASFDSEETASTRSSKVKMKATAIGVDRS